MKIENSLQQLNKLENKSIDENFKKNLRVRLLNQFLEEDLNVDQARDTTLFGRIKSLMASSFNYLKFQSALNLSFLAMSVLSFSVVASYFALPESFKDNLFSKINDVEILSNVEGADVYLNGEYIGKTPIQNLNLKSGNYTLRVEKQGYDVFNESISVSSKEESRIVAELANLSSDDWLAYQNDKIGISFKYPSSWSITENFDDDSQVSIVLSKEGWQYSITTGTNLSLGLVSEPEIKTYQKEILSSYSGNIFKRFIQFAQDGNYLVGGLLFNTADKDLVAFYDLDGTEEDILDSYVLNLMDSISKTLNFNNGTEVVALDDTTKDELIDISQIPENQITQVPTVSPTPISEKPIVALSNSFINDVYGYLISYPKNWNVSDSRAYYPRESSGFSMSTSSGTIEFARLKLRSKDSGRIYLLTTYQEFDGLLVGDDICSSGSLIESFGNGFDLKKVNSSYNRYNYQMCQGANGILKFMSNSNGSVSYLLYWEIPDAEFSAQALDEFRAISDSLKFDSSFLNTSISDIKSIYNDFESGISFQYPFNWLVSRQMVGEGTQIDIKNNKKQLVLTVSKQASKKQIPPEFTPNDIYTIKTTQMDLLFQEYYSQNCVEGVCEAKKFEYGTYVSGQGDMEIIYYQRPRDNKLLLSTIQSLKF